MASTLARSCDHAGNAQLRDNNIIMRESSSRAPRSWSDRIKDLVAPASKQNASQETLSEDGFGERKRSASESISKWGSNVSLGKKSQEMISQLETDDVHHVNDLVKDLVKTKPKMMPREERPALAARAYSRAEDEATIIPEPAALSCAVGDALSIASKFGDMASSGQENIMHPSKLLSKRNSLNSALKLNNTTTKSLNRFPLRSKLTTQRSTEQLSVHKSAIRNQRSEHDSKYGRVSHAKVSFEIDCDSKRDNSAESAHTLAVTRTNDPASRRTSTANATNLPQTVASQSAPDLQLSPKCLHTMTNASGVHHSWPSSRIPVPLHSAKSASQTPSSQVSNSRQPSSKSASLVSLCGSHSRLPVSTRTTLTRTSRFAMDKIASFTAMQKLPSPVQPVLSHSQSLERPSDKKLESDSQLANGLESDASGAGNAMLLVSSEDFECGAEDARNEKRRELVHPTVSQPSSHPSHLDTKPQLPTQEAVHHSSNKEPPNMLHNDGGNSLVDADPIQNISANIFRVLMPFLKDSEREKQLAAQLLSVQLKDGLARFGLCSVKCRHSPAMDQNTDTGTKVALNTPTTGIKSHRLDLSQPQNKPPNALTFRLAPGIRNAFKPGSISESSCGRGSVTGCSCNGSDETCTENSEDGPNSGPKNRTNARLEEAKMTSKLALSRYYSSLEAVNAQNQKLADNAETASLSGTLSKMGWNASHFQTSASAIGRYMDGYPIAKSLAPVSGSPATRRKRTGSKKRESNANNIHKGPLMGSDTLDVVRARAASTRSLASNQSMIASMGSLHSRLTSAEPQSE
ncbi:hypothetical protein BJ741DRAFT_636282 [Chytriomyces cf. hyalinus JEL632]|nr:hypothetical protein BJ741DRAFT_636282 [Chytriomyces cf. hyalinus JEL632]